jgi:acetylornithine/succinyldiaminopimelate/putrescine aminotransferase
MTTTILKLMPHTERYQEKLDSIRRMSGKPSTRGLQATELTWFLERDARLRKAIDLAWESHSQYFEQYRAWVARDEIEFLQHLQKAYVNFYDPHTVNPYVALNGYGPWVITWYGSVLYETGGYGMLGFGHNPEHVAQAMAQPYLMANIMTPCVSQDRLATRLQKEIGRNWRKKNDKQQPFAKFLCMNSGSEAMTVACRIADVHAKILSDKGARHHGKTRKYLALKSAFHGRTDQPAQASDSSMPKYKQHLASFAERDNLWNISCNDLPALQEAFARAVREGVFLEAMFLEPVMGEGSPGTAITPAFYKMARQLTQDHGCILIIDSIQAGLRARGTLSIVDYPGFEDLPTPDMESYSKALNAGQFPLSILALSEQAANLYRTGIYGNTMTTNPRALEVACAVLDHITDELRTNIVERGKELVQKLEELRVKFPEIITSVRGTGLLISAEIDPKKFKVVAANGLETYLRMNGINVIHGGANAIRLTPCFDISSIEIDLIISKIADAFTHAKP